MNTVEKKSNKLGLRFEEIQNILSQDALTSMEMNELYGGTESKSNKCSKCDNCNKCDNCSNCSTTCNPKNGACDVVVELPDTLQPPSTFQPYLPIFP